MFKKNSLGQTVERTQVGKRFTVTRTRLYTGWFRSPEVLYDGTDRMEAIAIYKKASR